MSDDVDRTPRARASVDIAPARVPGDATGEIAAEASSLRVAVPLWIVVLCFAVIALLRSAQVDIPMRDPGHQLFFNQVPRGLLLVALLGAADVLVRTIRAGWSGRRLVEVARARWPWRRVVLALTGVLAYYTIYVSYRNLKSWDVLNTPRDTGMLAFDKAIFFGHSPALLLHDLLGTGVAATVLSGFYSSFTYLVPTTLVLALGLIARVRQAYVFLCAACWTWILGTVSHFLEENMGVAPLGNPPLARAVQATHTGYFRAGPLTQDLMWEQYAMPVALETLLEGNAAGLILNPTPATALVPPLSPRGDVWINKTGSTSGFGAYVAFVPQDRLGLVLLANKNYPIPDRIRAAYAIQRRLKIAR